MSRRRLSARELPAKLVNRKSKAARGGDSSKCSGVPKVFQEMLQETEGSSAALSNDCQRALKRRKISEETVGSSQDESKEHLDSFSLFGSSELDREDCHSIRQQIIYEDNSCSEESDVEFEDVKLTPDRGNGEGDDERPEQKSLQLDLTESVRSGPKRVLPRRRPVTKAERSLRLDVHKWHLLCLLLHLQCRNRWCENETVQAYVKPLVPRKTISLLHVDESKPQYQRTHSFNAGIEEICGIWRQEWTITEAGMSRSFWKEHLDVSREVDEAGDWTDMEEFKDAAKTRSGSRDLGAQIFCALLRSVAVDTRLVCSLQTLPFAGTAKEQTPEKARLSYIRAPPQLFETRTSEPETAVSANPQWRASDYASIAQLQSLAPQKSPKGRIQESPYPIFWVEVFSPAATTWIPLDPLVRNTINKPKSGFEPPASDQLNSMSYVIALEEDGSAKDVTRRYTQFYNAKTRKTRVESTKGGEQWWKKTMRMFHKSTLLQEDRDTIEDMELAKREMSEAMPRNVQDFKGHPIYVLERHLRRNEVVHPRREVGKVSTGSAKSKDRKLESVFRRRDVHVVRSSDQWYRRGRDVKPGQVGLKRAKPKAGKDDSYSEGEGGDDGSILYAEFQTDIYVPPPVVKGKVPKNVYGNLDVYVPNMIPAGAIHLQHPEAAKAARLLGLHYVDAVTGFDFKGRQGTAVINGIVVAADYREALVEAVQAIEYERIQAEEEKKSALMLQLWKRFLTALRIRKRVDENYGDHGNDAVCDNEDENEDETYREDGEDAGGGFMPEIMEQEPAEVQSDGLVSTIDPLPELLAPPPEAIYHEIIIAESPHKLPTAKIADSSTRDPLEQRAEFVDSEQEAGGFLIDDDENAVNHKNPKDNIFDSDDEQGGGFLPEAPEEAENSGRFLPESPRDTGRAVFTLDTANSDAVLDPPMDKEMAQTSPPPAEESARASLLAIVPPSPQDAIREDDDLSSLLSHDPDDEDADPEWLVDSDQN